MLTVVHASMQAVKRVLIHMFGRYSKEKIMPTWLVKSAAVVGFSFLAVAAQANPALPAYNLDFTQKTGTNPKDYFTNVKPVGWTFGNGGNLIFVDAPGSPGCATCADGPVYLQVYGPFPNPPVPGNYVEADGNPDFESVFYEPISGLTPGTTYTLSFYQAAGQQTGFDGATTEQWIVSLGTSALTVTTSGGFGHYSNADPLADTKVSALMNTPNHGVTPWNFVSLDFTAHATDELLSFLAWGNNGSTINEPPMVFLAGVNQPDVIPEPETLSLLALALVGLGVSRLRRPVKRTAQA